MAAATGPCDPGPGSGMRPGQGCAPRVVELDEGERWRHRRALQVDAGNMTELPDTQRGGQPLLRQRNSGEGRGSVTGQTLNRARR